MKKLIIVAGIALMASSAWAGPGVSSGGGAFICSDPTQSEFFDLWEGENPQFATDPDGNSPNPPLPLLNIPQSSDPVDAQVQKVFSRLSSSPAIYQAIISVYGVVKSAAVNSLPTGVELSWPSDEENKYIKAGCSAKAIILFHDENNSMDVDADSLNSLPNTEQAALWVHETIYKFLRQTQGDANSFRARQLVALLFSDQSNQAILPKFKDVASLNFGPTLGAQPGPVLENGLETLTYWADYPGEVVSIKYSVVFSPELSDHRCKGLSDPSNGGQAVINDSVKEYSHRVDDENPTMFGESMGDFFNQTAWDFFSKTSLNCTVIYTFTDNSGQPINIPISTDVSGLFHSVTLYWR